MYSVWRTCNKIRAALSRIRFNLWDCFSPFDTQENSLISEKNFIGVLNGPLGKTIGLSNQEICELADYFRTEDGRIYYVQFCTVIHENNPNFECHYPWTTSLEWEDELQTNCLSILEEKRLGIILSKIAALVNLRKHILEPYFQDYELISKNCGVVTYAHFMRVIHFLNIALASEEMNLLLKKYTKDSYTVNYVAFIKTINQIQAFLDKRKCLDAGGDLLPDIPARVIEVKFPKLVRPEIDKIRTACVFPKQLHFFPVDEKSKRSRSVQEIMLRLQDHVYKNKIRVREYLQGFDVYNVGKISRHQFERGLKEIRQSPLGEVYLATEEFERLVAFYKDPNDMDRICWRTFEDDLEHVYTVKHLEKHPNLKADSPPPEVKNLPRKGNRDSECFRMASEKEMKSIYQKTLKKIIYRLKGRRFSLTPFFRDFDKLNLGHVSRAQLREVFATAAVPLTVEEISSLEYKYNNDMGFHYLPFLRELERQVDELSNADKEQSKCKTNLGKQERQIPLEEKDIDFILAKIKAKVVSNGIKANEFIRKFDHRNVKIVTRFDFHRGLDQLNCQLTCAEANTLMDHFEDCDKPGYVDYAKFTAVIEGAVTQEHLDKSPMTEPMRLVPSEASRQSFLNFDDRQILMRVLNFLTRYIDYNLEELFRDYDKRLNLGTVTKTELTRAFSTRGILSKLAANEVDILFRCFTRGPKEEPKFDYIAFLNAIRILKHNEIVVPF